jgi:hypothetical protein
MKDTTTSTHLQQDNGHTRGDSGDDVHAQADGKSRCGTGGARLSTSATRGLSRAATNNTGTLSASSLKQVGAAGSGRSRNSGLGGRLALEAATVGHSLGVCVEGERQLLLVGAHAISAVRTSSGVLVDASAVLARLLTADEAEDVAEVRLDGVVSNNAAESLGHAGAELGVGSGRERARLSLPLAGGNLGACGGSGVGGSVRIHLDTAGVDLGDLLLEVLEVLVGSSLAVVDGSET